MGKPMGKPSFRRWGDRGDTHQPSPGRFLQGFQAVAVAPLSALTLSRLLAALEAGDFADSSCIQGTWRS